MAITLWDLQINLSRKGVATSTEGVTGSNVNYLRSRKSEHLLDLLFKWMKYFCIQFLLLLQHLFVSLFFSCLHFCLLSLVEIIKCIVKSLKYNRKKKAWSIFWSPKLIYWSPTGLNTPLICSRFFSLKIQFQKFNLTLSVWASKLDIKECLEKSLSIHLPTSFVPPSS